MSTRATIVAVAALVIATVPVVSTQAAVAGSLEVVVAPALPGDLVFVDAWDAVTGERFPADEYPIIVDSPVGSDRGIPAVTAQFAALAAGDYKLRARIYGPAGTCGDDLYEWYPDASNHAAAHGVAVLMAALTSIEIWADRPMGCYEGTFYEFDSGTPITATVPHPGGGDPVGVVCLAVYEEAGPWVGQFAYNRADGTYGPGTLPAGRYQALAYDCEESDTHYLDAWYSGSFPVAGLRGPWGDIGPSVLPAGGTSWWPNPRHTGRARTFFIPSGGTKSDVDGILPLVPSCNGLTPTIIGTTVRDWLHGTSGDDVMLALAGNDIVYGYEGDDTLCLGPGNDRAFASDGRDIVIGGTGVDRMFGGLDHDTLIGNGGDDIARGGGGADLMYGGPGDDFLQGAAGAPDEAHGNADTDTCLAEITTTCELP